MRARCKNKNAPNYRYYGARGIAVCAEWDTDFLAFYNWSIHNGYATGLSITLRDNDRNYEPGNCEWSSPTKRNRNQRGTKLDFTKAVEIRNKKAAGVSAFDLSKQYNISVTHVHGIVSGRKWNGVA
jgi:SLT domain-containing protein